MSRANQQRLSRAASLKLRSLGALPSHTFLTAWYSAEVIARPLCHVGPIVKWATKKGVVWLESLGTLQIHKCEISQAPSQTQITKINSSKTLPRESAVGVIDRNKSSAEDNKQVTEQSCGTKGHVVAKQMQQ